METLGRADKIATALQAALRATWPESRWPQGHCAVSSLLLAPILRAAGETGARVAVGTVRIEGSARAHAWVQIPAGKVDITFGQFDGGPSLRVAPAGELSGVVYEVGRVLSLDEEEGARRSIEVTRFGDARSGTFSGEYHVPAIMGRR